MAKKKNPMQTHNDALFTAAVRQQLQKTRTDALKQGVFAICKVVTDKANAEGKTAEEKLADIVNFCSVWVKKPEKDAAEDKSNEV